MTIASNKERLDGGAIHLARLVAAMRTVPEEQELLTLGEAAKIAGRSYTWARDNSIRRRLETRQVLGSSRKYVTRDSVVALMHAEAARRQQPALRLVIDNTR